MPTARETHPHRTARTRADRRLEILRDGKPEVTCRRYATTMSIAPENEAVVQGAARDAAFDTLCARALFRTCFQLVRSLLLEP